MRSAMMFWLVALAPLSLHAAVFETIALTGQPAPGTDRTYAAFDFPVINDAGQVAFTASLYRSFSITSDRALYRVSPGGSPQYIARDGETHGGVELADIQSITLSNAGNVAFTAYAGPRPIISGTPNALFSATPGAVSLVAREGHASTPDGATFGHVAWPAINGANQIAFMAGARWIGTPAAQTRVAYLGQPIPELGGSITHVSSTLPMISAAGQTPFVAQANGTTSLFVAATTSRSVLATVGQAVPGAPAGVNYDGFNAPRINSAGRVATTGYVWGPAVTNNTSDAIFVTTDAQPLALVARAGEQAPGAPAGVLYDYFYEANISDDNRVGF